MFLRQIFAIFANFCQIPEMKYLRKIHRQSIHEIKSTQKNKRFFVFQNLQNLHFFISELLKLNPCELLKKLHTKYSLLKVAVPVEVLFCLGSGSGNNMISAISIYYLQYHEDPFSALAKYFIGL